MRILLHLPIGLFLYLSLLSEYRADSDEPPCFVVSRSKCTELGSETKCQFSTDRAQIFCCNVTKEQQLIDFFKNNVSSPDHILAFHMRDSTLEKLEVAIFDLFKKLSSFSLTNSNITHISGAFDGPTSITCLNISHNVIEEMYPFVLLKLKGLKNIVLSNNTNITVLPDFPSDLNKGFKLDVSGNLKLECKYLINLTIAHAEQTIMFSLNNRNSTLCSPPTNKINNYVKPIYMNMDHIDQVREIVANCPSVNRTNKCVCSVYALDMDQHNKPIYQALVNCSRRSMTSLPNKLPLATRVLDVSHNNITSFDGIGSKTFDNIRELNADNNRITSLKPLEGSQFLYQFSNLSLRNNKIDQIKIYMLSNVFDRLQGTRIMLANNEFKCDCPTSSMVKAWLIVNKDHVPDYAKIYANCEKSRTRVIDLDPKDLCAKPAEWKHFIRFVIYGEVIIFVLLVGKVSYDYYIFKTFGYLPWPASRMPKLPCDWCFEN
ncbi:hypothetical protein V9T40_014520 [Parthenolecanium corni]|uniref:Protein halfway n=1 Tax=Parthenolecanium corni TaxID=536013 RepID=A0AAN9TGJ1_9HEMI